MSEKWKAIQNFGEDNFMISTNGNIKKLAYDFRDSKGRLHHYKECAVKIHYSKIRGREYGHATLCYKGMTKIITIHIEVAKAFIPNPENKPEVNHRDGNKRNNNVDNLEWVSRVENMHHARINDLLNPVMGGNHFRSKKVQAFHYKTGQLLATFESVHIAAIFCGAKDGGNHIAEVCNGKRDYAFGYKWRYVEETVTTNK